MAAVTPLCVTSTGQTRPYSTGAGDSLTGGSATTTLAQILANGNTTGAVDLVISAGQALSTALVQAASGATLTLRNTAQTAGASSIVLPSPSAGVDGDGGAIESYAGAGAGTGQGGYFYFVAGNAPNAGNGGTFDFIGGNSSTGTAGYVSLQSGNSSGNFGAVASVEGATATAGGSFAAIGGQGTGTANGGFIHLYAGNGIGSGGGGEVRVRGGATNTTAAGHIILEGGASGSGAAGSIYLYGGSSASSTDGSVFIGSQQSVPYWQFEPDGDLRTIAGTGLVQTTIVIIGAESTAGIRLDLETGVLAVREGDDSAYAPMNTGAIVSSSSFSGTGLSGLAAADVFVNAVTGQKIAFTINSVEIAAVNVSALTLADAKDIVVGTTTGTKIGTSTTQKIGFWNSAPVVQQTSAALTNNVTAGGTTDVIADYTIVDYATDSTTIRNDIYQLARKLKEVGDALRLYGILG